MSHELKETKPDLFECDECGHVVFVSSWDPFRKVVLDEGTLNEEERLKVQHSFSRGVTVSVEADNRPGIARMVDDLDLGGDE